MMKKLVMAPNTMIRYIRLKNFKSYKDSGDICFKPLTILIGANNCGKSTILQAIKLIRQSECEINPGGSPIITSGDDVNLGGYYSIVRGGSKSKGNGFEVDIHLSDDLRLKSRFAFDAQASQIVIEEQSFTGKDFAFSMKSQGREWSMDSCNNNNTRNCTPRLVRGVIPFLLDAPNSNTRDSELKKAAEKLYGMACTFHFLMTSVSSMPPLRARTPWYSLAGANSSVNFGAGGENLIAAFANDKYKSPLSDASLIEQMNEWISKRLGLLASVRVQRLDSGGAILSLIGNEKNGIKGINLAAMGEGVSQVLPVIAFTLGRYASSCQIVEQPELHLHPAMQTGLADLFIHAVKNQKKQLIIETHSEHLLLRIRRRIAEGKTVDGQVLTPEDVAVLYVEKGKEGSTVREVNIDEHGQFTDWPDGFFDEAYKEAMLIAMARKPE